MFAQGPNMLVDCVASEFIRALRFTSPGVITYLVESRCGGCPRPCQFKPSPKTERLQTGRLGSRLKNPNTVN
eukprot:5897489-Amphidinium_carterae.1